MLFRNENPNLGPLTTVNEIALTSTSSVTVASSNLKPGTREIISVPLIAAGGANSQWVFQAPFACQVVAIRFNGTVVGAASNLSIEKITADGLAPAAANGTTIVLLTAAVFALNTFTPNTRANLALSAVTSANLLNAGDQIALFVSAASTGLLGAMVQIEIAQIG